jgi:hypothetical protein
MSFAFPTSASAYALWGYKWQTTNNDVLYCYPTGGWPAGSVAVIDSGAYAWDNLAGSNLDFIKTSNCASAKVEVRYQVPPNDPSVHSRTECVVNETTDLFVACDVYFNSGPTYANDFLWAVSQNCSVNSLSPQWFGGSDCRILGAVASRHEFAHVAGLAHVGGANGCALGYDDGSFGTACPADDEPQMVTFAGDGYSRVISQDDRNGVDFLYPSGS